MTDDRRLGDGPRGSLSIALDTVFELLADRRRRFTLYSLSGATDGIVEFSTLVEDVATLEASQLRSAVTADRIRDVAADLRHWHLPVLADVGVVEYDERSGTIRYRATGQLETWLHRIRVEELSE